MLREEIHKYVKDYMAALNKGELKTPSVGDCWYCAWRVVADPTGKTLGEATHADHLLSHIAESYFVPSLLVRALEVYPVSQVALWYLNGCWTGNDSELTASVHKVAQRQLRASLRRYLYHWEGALLA